MKRKANEKGITLIGVTVAIALIAILSCMRNKGYER